MKKVGCLIKCDVQSLVLILSLFIITYQWLFHLTLAYFGMISDKDILKLVNPYVLLSIIIFICLITLMIRDKMVAAFFFLLSFIAAIAFIKYFGFDKFPGNFLKSVQYMYGIIIIFIGFFLILKMIGGNYTGIPKRLVSILVLIIGGVTLLDLVLANFVYTAKSFFMYSGLDISNIYINLGYIKTRPFGLSLSPQANAYTLASLVLLNYIYNEKLNAVTLFGIFCVIMTFSGTGVALLLIGMFFYFKLPYIKLPVIFFIILIFLNYTDKFSMFYFDRVYGIFNKDLVKYFYNFGLNEWLFGSRTPSFNNSGPLTTDWAYLDVIYEYGVLGLALYVGVFYKIIRLALPIKYSKRMHTFPWLLLLINTHYPSLNYFVSQMAFGILAAINMHNTRFVFYRVPVMTKPDRSCKCWVLKTSDSGFGKL